MDKEIEAMQAAYSALSDLSDEERSRVLSWVTSKFAITSPVPASKMTTEASSTRYQSSSSGEGAKADPSIVDGEFKDVADLYSACAPSNNADKVLVVGYWHQVIGGDETLSSAKVNKDLRHLGHGVKRMNDAFTSLMSAKPQLAIQTRKSGNAKQARKTYKITREGIKRVEKMIAGTLSNDTD